MGIEKKISLIKEGLSRRTFPIAGDFVELPDGRVGRLSIIRDYQRIHVIGNYESISVYLEPDFFPVHAGGDTFDPDFYDVDFDLSSVSDTGKTKSASAWTFKHLPEAGGAIWFKLNFKVWKVENLKSIKIPDAYSVKQKFTKNGNPIYLVTGYDQDYRPVAFFSDSKLLDQSSVSNYELIEASEPNYMDGKFWAKIIGVKK